MAEILRYVTIDKDGEDGEDEFETAREAIEAARRIGGAVMMRTYEYADSELVWTPDGGDTWPPEQVCDDCRSNGPRARCDCNEPEQSEPMDYDAARDFARDEEA